MLVGLPDVAYADPPDMALFALVVGNNQPEQQGGTVLRYADDDALAMDALFRENGVQTRVLASLDRQTRARLSGAHVQPATAQKLASQIKRIRTGIAQARATGKQTEFYFYYSGHGDWADGEGYLRLDDGRLTRTALAKMLRTVGADRHHVIIDACKSYYMALERGPGGTPRPYRGPLPVQGVPAEMPNVGFVLSTSSDRPSHEWERYSSGVVSHEVRSALRGAADVDRDGTITYTELGAFITTANLKVPQKYRPDTYISAPRRGSSEVVWRWQPGPALNLGGEVEGRLFIEDAEGDRIADLNADQQQPLRLRLPPRRPLYLVAPDEGQAFIIRGQESPVLEPDEDHGFAVRDKGAAEAAFAHLFGAPFSRTSVEMFAALAPAGIGYSDKPERTSPESRRMDTSSSLDSYAWIAAGVAGVAIASATGSALLTYENAERARAACSAGCTDSQLERKQRLGQTLQPVAVGSAILGGVAAVSSIVLLLINQQEDAPAAHPPAIGIGPASASVSGSF